VKRALLAAVRFYQRAISPVLPPRCRFEPSCSAYAAEALQVHGAARGSWLALRRLLKCAPWHPGGLDLVPPARGTAGHVHSSGSTAPSAVLPAGVEPRPDRVTPTVASPVTSPANGRSAQQEARVA
jgi:putative membrane protein insertion efficiency factor